MLAHFTHVRVVAAPASIKCCSQLEIRVAELASQVKGRVFDLGNLEPEQIRQIWVVVPYVVQLAMAVVALTHLFLLPVSGIYPAVLQLSQVVAPASHFAKVQSSGEELLAASHFPTSDSFFSKHSVQASTAQMEHPARHLFTAKVEPRRARISIV